MKLESLAQSTEAMLNLGWYTQAMRRKMMENGDEKGEREKKSAV